MSGAFCDLLSAVPPMHLQFLRENMRCFGYMDQWAGVSNTGGGGGSTGTFGLRQGNILQHKDKQLARMQENVESQYKLLVNYQHHEGVADARIAQLVTYVSALKHGEEMEIDPDALVLKANQENVVEALKTRFDKEKAQELRVVKLRNKMKFKSRYCSCWCPPPPLLGGTVALKKSIGNTRRRRKNFLQVISELLRF